jgi:hypothetical protein
MASITVTLGGVDYSVPKLNLGQMREVTKAFSGDKDDISFSILAIALKRADPKPIDPMAIEAEVTEIGAAVSAILEFAGFTKAAAENPTAPRAEATG